MLFTSANAAAFSEVRVPAAGYSATDTLTADSPETYYLVTVPAGHELVFEFHATGGGSFSVFLSRADDPLNYYASFSSTQPVSDFSGSFPADYGFEQEYFIQLNATSGTEVEYTADIHTEDTEEDYTIYYALILLGLVGLVAFSYKFVVWQEAQERKAADGKRRERRRR